MSVRSWWKCVDMLSGDALWWREKGAFCLFDVWLNEISTSHTSEWNWFGFSKQEYSSYEVLWICLCLNIFFGRPGWRSYGNVEKSAQQICLGAWLQQTTSQSLNQHGKVICVPIRQRVQLLRLQLLRFFLFSFVLLMTFTARWWW